MVNVEVLDFTGKADNNLGTDVSLSYDAVYGITQVGGLYTLQIDGNTGGAGKDSVHLEASGTNTWAFVETKGGFNFYEAGAAGAVASVKVEQGIQVDLS
jgi:hypothetical protein